MTKAQVHKAVTPDKLTKAGAARLQQMLDTGEFALYTKLDGTYSQISTDSAIAISRTSEPQPAVDPKFIQDCRNASEWFFADEREVIFCGELWTPGKTHSELNGAARRHEVQPWLGFYIFDVYIPSMPDTSFNSRMAWLDIMYRKMGYCNKVDPIRRGAGPTTWDNLCKLAEGQKLKTLEGAYDGLILRDWEAPFVPGSGTKGGIIKVKPRADIDARVVGVFDGNGKYKGMIGGLIVDLGGGITCEVGSGLTDTERGFDPAFWLGKIVQVSYLSLTNKGLLREPAFERIRLDKTEAQTIHNVPSQD